MLLLRSKANFTFLFQTITRTKGNQSYSGFATILTQLSGEAKAFPVPTETEARLNILQWLDYTILFVLPARGDKHTTQHLLKELDAVLSTKSYLAGNQVTLADISVFYGLEQIMLNLTNGEKEAYINVSRWFNHLQQIKGFVQGRAPVNFSTIFLVGWTKGTHI